MLEELKSDKDILLEMKNAINELCQHLHDFMADPKRDGSANWRNIIKAIAVRAEVQICLEGIATDDGSTYSEDDALKKDKAAVYGAFRDACVIGKINDGKWIHPPRQVAEANKGPDTMLDAVSAYTKLMQLQFVRARGTNMKASPGIAG